MRAEDSKNGAIRVSNGRFSASIGRSLALLLLCSLAAFGAASGKSTETEEEGGATTPATSGSTEVFKNITIAANKSVSLDSTLDFTSAAAVAVLIRCTACSTASFSLASSGLVFQAFWIVPDADLYTVAEAATPTGFPYWDSGGLIFETFGTKFRLTIQNNSDQGISLRQVTLFRRMQ
jgi:hypothetical protein